MNVYLGRQFSHKKNIFDHRPIWFSGFSWTDVVHLKRSTGHLDLKAFQWQFLVAVIWCLPAFLLGFLQWFVLLHLRRCTHFGIVAAQPLFCFQSLQMTLCQSMVVAGECTCLLANSLLWFGEFPKTLAHLLTQRVLFVSTAQKKSQFLILCNWDFWISPSVLEKVLKTCGPPHCVWILVSAGTASNLDSAAQTAVFPFGGQKMVSLQMSVLGQSGVGISRPLPSRIKDSWIRQLLPWRNQMKHNFSSTHKVLKRVTCCVENLLIFSVCSCQLAIFWPR